MSAKVHPIALTTAILCGARTTVPETADAEAVADLASRIHRCGMAIRRAILANNDKALQRAMDWKASLNVGLEDYGCCRLIMHTGHTMYMSYPSGPAPHWIC